MIRVKRKITKILCIFLATCFCFLAIGTLTAFAATPIIAAECIYNIKNVYSGKCLQVHAGTDTNGQNVNQWTQDGTVDQKFRLEYYGSSNAFKFRAMCSSSGTNRVVDVSRSSGNIVAGCNIQIWTADDDDAQLFKIVQVATGKYKIVLNSNTNLCLTVVDGSNGTSSGKTSTSPGNVYLDTYSSSNTKQQWTFEEVQVDFSHPFDDGDYYFQNVKSSKYLAVENASTSSGAKIVQMSHNEVTSQQFRLTYMNDGYYKIQPLSNLNMAVTVENGVGTTWADIQQEPDVGSDAQRWKILQNSDGTFRILSKCSNNFRGFDIDGSAPNYGMSDGDQLLQYAYSGNTNQKWKITSTITLEQAINALRSQYPDGAYWNHTRGQSSTPDTYSNTACIHHSDGDNSDCTLYGTCGGSGQQCNSYYDGVSRGIQCNGFTRKISKELFGTSWASWSTSTNANDARVGDIVKYKNSDGALHYVMVIGFQGSDFLIVDVNWNCNCNIRWDATASKSSMGNLPFNIVYLHP